MAVEERDPLTGYLTTGHEWNGITELNTPVPRAVYFFLINWIKVPFAIFLSHNIDLDSVRFAVLLFPFAILGGLAGKPLASRISQRRFEQLALALTALGSLWMLCRSLFL